MFYIGPRFVFINYYNINITVYYKGLGYRGVKQM